MLIKGFEVYDGEALIEVLSAIVSGGGRVNVRTDESGNPLFNTVVEVTAQVPQGVSQVDFLNADTGQVLATVPASDGKAVLEVDWRKRGILRVRVGPETKTKLNEAVVEGYVE